MLLPSGNPFKYHEEALDLQPMILHKRFDIFPPDWGMLRKSRYVQILRLEMVLYICKAINESVQTYNGGFSPDIITSGANLYPGVGFADVMTSFSGVTFVLLCFVFIFMLSLKPRPFVQSFFDMQAPDSHTCFFFFSTLFYFIWRRHFFHCHLLLLIV